MHQRRLDLDDLLRDWLPQIGLGIRGFLFWQYRPEVLGYESPAWGVVNLDGTDRDVTTAVKGFWEGLSPHIEELMELPPRAPEIGIWKSRKNEIFHFCIHNTLENLVASVEGYVHQLYWDNYAYRFISGEMLALGDLAGLKVLIMPSPYYLTQDEADQLDQWVQSGGILLSEAQLGGYNGTTGRHSRLLPGCGLSEKWGISETMSTSSFHLQTQNPKAFEGAASEDTRKALAELGTQGGLYFPILLEEGSIAWGADRFAVIETDGPCHLEGSFDGPPCIISQKVGKGWVLYAGSNLGQGSHQDPTGFGILLRKVLSNARVSPMLSLDCSIPGQVRIDPIINHQGKIRFLVVQNRCNQPVQVKTNTPLRGSGVFSGLDWSSGTNVFQDLPPKFIDFINIRD